MVSECPERSLNVTKAILQSCTDSLTDPKTLRNQKLSMFHEAVVTSQSEFFTGKCFAV